MAPDSGPAAGGVIPVELDTAAFGAALPVLLPIYTAAMGYSPATGAARRPLWLEHATRPGFRCVIALDIDEVVAFGYGYTGARGQWWFEEVARGLGTHQHPSLADYFELTELHVLPDRQGRGTGEMVLRELLSLVSRSQVLLSTPEGKSRAWRLYRRLGFGDVLRNFLFTGDSRPFAVLGRSLPLDPQDHLRQ